jgi:hypothetical protein
MQCQALRGSNEYSRHSPLVEPFSSVPSQPLATPTPVAMTVTPLRPRHSTERATAASTPHRDEKRLLPIGPRYTMEWISRLNLGLSANPRDHSVVGEPSNHEPEVSAVPRPNREDDGGVSLQGSSETINPKALRLPPAYRRFYP